MTQPTGLRRWTAFTAAASVLVTGIALLSVQAANCSLASPPDDAPPPNRAAPSGGPDGRDSPVVDRLNSWGETAAKKNISPVKGGHKHG